MVIFTPGMEIKGYFDDIHIVNTYLNAWNGNKGVKMVFFGFLLTSQ
jgi:hypothetical protein